MFEPKKININTQKDTQSQKIVIQLTENQLVIKWIVVSTGIEPVSKV
jgi:hypothetical protein